MAGRVQTYDKKERHEKNKFMSAVVGEVVIYRFSNRKGELKQEIGLIVGDHVVRLPINANGLMEATGKLKDSIIAAVHPERVKKNTGGPDAAPVSRTPKDEVKDKLPKDEVSL